MLGVLGMKGMRCSCSGLEKEMELVVWELWRRRSCVKKL